MVVRVHLLLEAHRARKEKEYRQELHYRRVATKTVKNAANARNKKRMPRG